jgi:hypothetical protein
MRSRLLGGAAVLTLAVGGLIVSASSPASAHCGDFDHISGDQYDGGGIAFNDTPWRHAPHSECDIIGRITENTPDIHCAKDVPGSNNDWLYFNDGADREGWVRERAANVDGERRVHRCEAGGSVLITQNP